MSAACDSCDGSGAQPGTGVKTCATCGGHGQVRAQQGFFLIERTCPTCHGRGEVIENPCRKCGGDGRVEVELDEFQLRHLGAGALAAIPVIWA